MKKLFFAVVFIFTVAANAQAERVVTINNGISGLLLGAGGGALAGQAIGRDTESTLIGTAVGTMVGYIVGNEMDKGQGQPFQVMQRPAPAPVYREQRSGFRHQPEPAEYGYHPDDQCREVQILGPPGQRPERLITTACKTPQGWMLMEQPGRPAVYSNNPGNYRDQSKRKTHRPSKKNYTRRINYPY